MAQALTKEQFRAQFKYGPCTFTDLQPILTETWHGYEVYQCLQMLFLKDEQGKFWSAHRS
jgi:hypothetical protein